MAGVPGIICEAGGFGCGGITVVIAVVTAGGPVGIIVFKPDEPGFGPPHAAAAVVRVLVSVTVVMVVRVSV